MQKCGAERHDLLTLLGDVLVDGVEVVAQELEDREQSLAEVEHHSIPIK